MKVPFLEPSIDETDVEKLVESLRSGWFAPGVWTERLERGLADYLGAEHAVLVASCSAALHTSLVVTGVGEEDEVITTPTSWVATSNAILYRRAKPVFVDIDVDTGLIDPNRIEEKITDRTRAILPVHLFGQMADMRRIGTIARRHGLAVIEDAAHSIEAERDGLRPGHSGASACLSFHAGKNITAGQGGAMVTRDPSFAERARVLRRHGVTGRNEKRRMTMLGYKYELADYQAALLVGQLDRIGSLWDARRQVFERYRNGLADTAAQLPASTAPDRHAHHLFTIQVPGNRRDAIRRALGDRGVESSIHYRPIHLEPYYREVLGHSEGEFPMAERFGKRVISLPTYAGLTEEQQTHVIASLRTILAEGSAS